VNYVSLSYSTVQCAQRMKCFKCSLLTASCIVHTTVL